MYLLRRRFLCCLLTEGYLASPVPADTNVINTKMQQFFPQKVNNKLCYFIFHLRLTSSKQKNTKTMKES